MKTKVIKREGFKCLQNYEDNEVNIRLYINDDTEPDKYEVEFIDLDEDLYTYYVYNESWGPALEKYNYLVNRHIFRKELQSFGEAESIHTPLCKKNA